MTGAAAIAPLSDDTAALVETLLRPGVGTIVVTTRRFTTLRTTTGRGGAGWLAASW